MAKRDLGFAGAVEKVVEEKVIKMQKAGQISSPNEEQSDSEDFIEQSSSPEVKKMLSSFPSSEGFYAKIYKIKPNGKWVVLDYEITAPESVNDLELEVQRIVKEKKWGEGEYRVVVRKRGTKGMFLNESVTVGDPTSIGRENFGIPVTDPIENMKRTMEIVDSIRGPSNPESLSATILKAVETGRSMAPPPGDGKDNTLATLLQIVPMIKDLFPRAPQSDVDTIVEKVVTRLQSLQPKEDFFQSLIKYQEAMNKLNPPEKREREIDSIKKVTDIVSAIQPLTRGSAGEPPSMTQLIFEHGAKLLEPIISTLKEFAEAKKMEMQIRIDQAYGPNAIPAEKRRIESNVPAVRIHPFVARIIKAINEGDESYFDMMRQQIVRFYGPHIIDGLISGDLTSDLVIDTIHTELGLPLNIPNLKLYFDKFVAYLKGMDREPSVKGEVLAECKLCHAQFDFDNMEAWRKDTKKCEDCQGDLELVKGESEA